MGASLGKSLVGSVGGRPVLRVLSTTLAVLLLFFTSRWLPFHGRPDNLRFSSFRYEAPQDLFVYPGYGRSVEAESSIAKVTILFHGKDPTYIRAIQTHQAHNRRFGYPLLILRHGILDGIWSKPAYLLAILLEELRKPNGHRLQWLCWVDADTVVTNPNIPLDIFLPPEEFPHLHLLVTADPHGLNNGIFFLKVHPWSVALLSAVIAYPIFRPDQKLKYRDQSALEALVKDRKFGRNSAILPQRWFNAYQAERDGSRTLPFQFMPGDLLVHFPGVPDRGASMKHYIDLAEHHSPAWEISLESTNYLNETKEFWAEQQRALTKRRRKAERFAAEAREGLTTTQDQLKLHGGTLDSGELEQVEQHVRQLQDALEDNRDDLEAVKSAYENLQKSKRPLEEAVAKPKKDVHTQARAILSDGEQKLLQRQELGSNSDVDRQLHSQIGVLKRLLLETPDDLLAIKSAIDEMRKALDQEDSKDSKDTKSLNQPPN